MYRRSLKCVFILENFRNWNELFQAVFLNLQLEWCIYLKFMSFNSWIWLNNYEILWAWDIGLKCFEIMFMIWNQIRIIITMQSLLQLLGDSAMHFIDQALDVYFGGDFDFISPWFVFEFLQKAAAFLLQSRWTIAEILVVVENEEKWWISRHAWTTNVGIWAAFAAIAINSELLSNQPLSGFDVIFIWPKIET